MESQNILSLSLSPFFSPFKQSCWGIIDILYTKCIILYVFTNAYINKITIKINIINMSIKLKRFSVPLLVLLSCASLPLVYPGFIKYMLIFFFWFLLFITLILRCILIVMLPIVPYFLLLSSIPLYEYIPQLAYPLHCW